MATEQEREEAWPWKGAPYLRFFKQSEARPKSKRSRRERTGSPSPDAPGVCRPLTSARTNIPRIRFFYFAAEAKGARAPTFPLQRLCGNQGKYCRRREAAAYVPREEPEEREGRSGFRAIARERERNRKSPRNDVPLIRRENHIKVGRRSCRRPPTSSDYPGGCSFKKSLMCVNLRLVPFFPRF